MSELTQRIHRFMTPEQQEANSREFNALIDLLNNLRVDMRGVASKVDGLTMVMGEITGDLKTAHAEIGHLKSDVGKNSDKIDRLEQRKTPSKWTGGFKPWNGQRGGGSGPDTNTMVTLAKYVGIVLAGFVAGVGSLATAWNQLNEPPPQKTIIRTVPAEETQSVWPERDTNPNDDSERALK